MKFLSESLPSLFHLFLMLQRKHSLAFFFDLEVFGTFIDTDKHSVIHKKKLIVFDFNVYMVKNQPSHILSQKPYINLSFNDVKFRIYFNKMLIDVFLLNKKKKKRKKNCNPLTLYMKKKKSKFSECDITCFSTS